MTTKDEEDARIVEKELLHAFNQLRAIRGYPPLTEHPEPPYCSFCGRPKNEMGALVEGVNAYICLDCAGEARNLLLRA